MYNNNSLRSGTGLLASDELVQVALGGQVIEPENVEAGTGFYEQRTAVCSTRR